MLKNNHDVVIAFWDGKSNGTKHLIDNAKNKIIVELPTLLLNSNETTVNMLLLQQMNNKFFIDTLKCYPEEWIDLFLHSGKIEEKYSKFVDFLTFLYK